MPQLNRKAKIPVYDAEGNLLWYEVDYVPSNFEKKLRLGGSHLDEIKLEAQLRRHKKEAGWKEPPRVSIVCPKCGKVVKREHPTQKFCKVCGALNKKERANARQKKYIQRRREKNAVKASE